MISIDKKNIKVVMNHVTPIPKFSNHFVQHCVGEYQYLTFWS